MSELRRLGNEVTDEEKVAYQAKIATGGCLAWDCPEVGLPECAVWWKCACGYRKENRYCRKHGPEMLEIVVGSVSIDGPHYLYPMIEGLTQ